MSSTSAHFSGLVPSTERVGETVAKFADAGRFDLLMMGSVATRVLAHCKVPVLLVR